MVTEKKEELRITDKEEQLKIIGMHCATCVMSVSKSLKSVSGVKDAEVNLATGSAKVILSGNIRLKELVKAVRKTGRIQPNTVNIVWVLYDTHTLNPLKYKKE